MSDRKCVNCQHHKFATSSGDCDVSENSMSYSTMFEHSCDQWEGKPNIRKDCKKCIHSDICIFIEENPDCIQFKDRADLVEVVRCKDCKYCRTLKDGGSQCERIDGLLMTKPNDYCSYGERREE